MSCARRRPTSEVLTDDSLSKVVEQGVSKGLNRLLQLHERFAETQGLALQNHIQAFSAEQASLRTLLACQHEDMLQKILSLEPQKEQQHRPTEFFIGDGTTSSEHRTSTALLTVVPQQQPAISRSTKHSSSFLGFSRTAQAGDPKAEEEFMDLSKLPVHWPTDTRQKEDEAAENNYFFAKARNFIRDPRFDGIMAFVLFLNLLSMCFEMQWRSYQVSMLMGARSDDGGWQTAKVVFQVFDFIFSAIYVLELCLRVYVNRLAYFRHAVNVFDTIVVCLSFLATYLLQPLGLVGEGSKFTVARLIRMTRVVQFLKVGRIATASTELRILARALASSAGSLLSALVLLVAVIIAGSITIFQLLIGYMEDESKPAQDRQWVYDNFGSVTLCVLTLWESTFTTAWTKYARKMMIDINGYLAFFWVPYIICINFAVMKLIGALFLKQVFAIAASDGEKMNMMKLKEQQRFAHMIREIFIEGDTSGDGKISLKEFQEMVYDPHVGKCFENLQLEVAEVATLFQLLAADDGEADYEEFLEGALKLKNSAKTVDVIQLLHANQATHKQIEIVHQAVLELKTAATSVSMLQSANSGKAEHRVAGA